MKFGIWELVIVFLIVLVLFGTKRARTIPADIAYMIKSFKKEMNDDGEAAKMEETQTAQTTPKGTEEQAKS